jgi:hypothetical protein
MNTITKLGLASLIALSACSESPNHTYPRTAATAHVRFDSTSVKRDAAFVLDSAYRACDDLGSAPYHTQPRSAYTGVPRENRMCKGYFVTKQR